MNKQVYTPKQDYKVLVNCMTYNQSKYIEDALNGFAMQKTNFPFVCLVMDDYSTDGEQEVIKAWMDRECDMTRAEYEEIELSNIILVPHKTNPTCTFAFYLLKQNLYGCDLKTTLLAPWRCHCNYDAMCEGDDYWIDSQKLQLEVDFLDSTGLKVVYTNFDIKYQDINVYKKNCLLFDISKIPSNQVIEKWILDKPYIGPMTCLVASDLIIEASKINIKTLDGSFVFFAFYLFNKAVGVIPTRSTAVYRINKGSASHPSDLNALYKREKNLLETQLSLIDRFLPEPSKEPTRRIVTSTYYNTRFYLISAFAEKTELLNLQHFSTESLLHIFLLYIIKYQITRKAYKHFYIYYKITKEAFGQRSLRAGSVNHLK